MYIFYKKGRRKPNKISETRRTTVTVKITREKKKSHNGNEHRAGNKKAASKTTFSHSQRVEKREVNHQLQKQEKEAHTYTLHMAHSLRSYTPQCYTTTTTTTTTTMWEVGGCKFATVEQFSRHRFHFSNKGSMYPARILSGITLLTLWHSLHHLISSRPEIM